MIVLKFPLSLVNSPSTLINDRETGRPRGFGFIEMDDTGGSRW